MFDFNKRIEGSLEVCELSDRKGTVAKFVPARGGLLTEFLVENVPVFYLDRETLHDLSKNVRGGNPVLFPICGPLQDGRYSLPGGRQYEMNQHGLARNMRWETVDTGCFADNAQITLQAISNNRTKEAYPFDFKLVFTYTIEPGRVTIKQKYYNGSTVEMPFYAGFHPYFYAPGKKALSLNIPAHSYYDIKTAEHKPYEGKLNFDAKPETNLVFTYLSKNEAWFDREDGYRITVRFDENFRYIVLWTLRDKDFLCIEPWMGNNYDLNKGKARLLKPGEEFTATVSYSLTKL